MCGPHHCLGRDASASDSAIVRTLLQRHQNASIIGQRCAGLSPGSVDRKHQIASHPWWASSPLRPGLGFRYTHLVHVGKFFARNLGGLIRARTCAGPAREGKSRTPSMYAGEKSDEVVVLRKRPNKGRQLPAEVVEGRASPEGNSRQAAVVRTLSRAATSIRLAAVRRSALWFHAVRATDVRPEGGARCVSSARRDLCGGRGEILVPCTLRIAWRIHILPSSEEKGEPL